MTLIRPHMLICAVCGEDSEQEVLYSTSSFGSDDIDGRPHGLARASLGFYIQKCPHCGYVNGSIDVKPSFSIRKEWLKEYSYLTCDGIQFSSDLATMFYQQYLIKSAGNETSQALKAILGAAWACDDHHDLENAKKCRRIAATIVHGLYDRTKDQGYLLLWCDLMRRSGQFEKMVSDLDEIYFADEKVLWTPLLAFEVKHAKMKDAECYTYEEALDEMHTKHGIPIK